ncbi:response regulator [Brevibacillus sp. NPDC058079]|uniref:response regulator n=1 Tax=Brevibacillus sp. NPDC058079 TaxID=3346330 RepID=UPI0036EE42AF
MDKRVLIVDDAYFMRKLIKNKLEEAGGYVVVGEAKNGKEGITLYFELKPDFVTMDIKMDGISGIEATRQILSKDPDARIIAVTGCNDDEIMAEMMAAGAKDYLKKPFQPAFLLTSIENMFSKESASQMPETELTTVEPNGLEEDFFANTKFHLADKPDESRERLLVIENSEDLIEFPEEFIAEEREKNALTQKASPADKEIHQDEQSYESPIQPHEDFIEETIQQEPVLVTPMRQDANEETKDESAISTSEEPAPPPFSPHQSDEPNSYMQIKPPRGKVLTQPIYRSYEIDEELVEPVINDNDGDSSVPSQKKGFIAKLVNLFSKK